MSLMKIGVKKRIVTSIFSGLMMSSPLCFGAEFKIAAAHSNIGFVTRHLVSKITGQFNDFDGEFSFDAKKPTESKVSATVKVASINTNNQKRDGHLQSEDFFAVEKFPVMTFVSKKVTSAGKDKYKMLGDLTMHGVTHPVTFHVEYLGEAPGMDGKPRVGFTANAKVNRKEFGISWNKTLDNGGLVLSDEVEINLNIEAAPKM